MNILIIGAGGREHALAWQATQFGHFVYVAPGNAGTALEPQISNVAISATDIPALLQFATEKNIDLTIVGPEMPLVAGICDTFAAAGLMCFGPSRQAAQLEGSKSFAKDFLVRHNISTPCATRFTDVQAAKAFLSEQTFPLVIKADGLAAGKGVVIAHTHAQAVTTVDEMLGQQSFGTASQTIMIEQFVTGEEASFIALVGKQGQFKILATSQDHKARFEGDTGPNTGGMGAYSPAPIITPLLEQRIVESIITPTLNGLAADGIDYTGFLYAGLMITADNEPFVLEFNCRLGDPETQPLLLRLKSDLATLCLSALQGTLNERSVEWDKRPALGVVMTAKGYPGDYSTGHIIQNLPLSQHGKNPHQKVFHAGTKQQNNHIVTNGGRVLCVTSLGDTLAQAKAHSYTTVAKISWQGACWRSDIGDKALTDTTETS